MKFNKLDNSPNFSKIQEEILEFWDKNKTFAKSLENKNNKEISHHTCQNGCHQREH